MYCNESSQLLMPFVCTLTTPAEMLAIWRISGWASHTLYVKWTACRAQWALGKQT